MHIRQTPQEMSSVYA